MDKGNTTVTLNKSIYIKKMEESLGDTNTYALVKKDPASSIERKLNDIIKKWFREEYITKPSDAKSDRLDAHARRKSGDFSDVHVNIYM